MNSETSHIRWATLDDAEALIQLNYEFNGITNISIYDVQDSLSNSKELVAIAILEDKVVGFGCAQYYRSFCYADLYGEITELFVKEVARGRGIAPMLIAFLEKELKAIGVKNCKVLTGSENEIAIKTYKRVKYKIEEDLMLQRNLK